MIRESKFLSRTRSILLDPRSVALLWIILAIIAGIISKGNNFLIYRGVLHHLWDQISLYAPYPEEYFDINHYGPLFSIVIAPFALLPVWVGKLLWSVAIAAVLLWSIRSFPIEQKRRVFICWFCAHELMTALFMNQFNVVIAAIILFSFILVEREEDHWATLLIAIGTFVKLYGIVGVAFFFFSKHKIRFILTLAGWSLLLFLLPMAISSPEYVINSYAEWIGNIIEKNGANADSLYQNISLIGMAHRISGCNFSDLWIIVPGMLLTALPYLRLDQYKNQSFRIAFVASVLLFTVLFSTGSESSSYIIAFVGISLWYWSAPWKRGRWEIGLMVFAFILTSLSPSDLFPKYLRDAFVRPYSLKALPCVIIWVQLILEMLLRDYSPRYKSLKQ